MRRPSAIFALLGVLFLGTGTFAHLHRLDHEAHDAAHAHHHPHHHHHHHGDDGHGDAPPAHHDETNCELHAMLRAPIIGGGWTPVLVGLGLLVAFLTMLPTRVVERRAVARIDCRGPPGA